PPNLRLLVRHGATAPEYDCAELGRISDAEAAALVSDLEQQFGEIPQRAPPAAPARATEDPLRSPRLRARCPPPAAPTVQVAPRRRRAISRPWRRCWG